MKPGIAMDLRAVILPHIDDSGGGAITLTGDVTGSGSGSVATTIANDAVTFAKMQNVTGPGYVGRSLASSGDLSFLSEPGGTTLSAAILALNPTAFWELDETSGDFQDSGPGGYDAVVTGTVTRAASALLPGAEERFANFTSGTGNYGATSSLLGLTTPINGSWSFIALARPIQATGTSTRYLFGITGASELETNNDQLIVYFSSSQLFAFWEFGAGSNVTINGPGDLESHKSYLVHVTKNSATSTVTFYLNGVFAGSGTYANEPTGGSLANAKVMGRAATESAMIGGKVAFFNGVVHTQTQVEAVSMASGLFGI
jgi:hypothetical protein